MACMDLKLLTTLGKRKEEQEQEQQEEEEENRAGVRVRDFEDMCGPLGPRSFGQGFPKGVIALELATRLCN